MGRPDGKNLQILDLHRLASLCMYVCMYVCKDVCRLAGRSAVF